MKTMRFCEIEPQYIYKKTILPKEKKFPELIKDLINRFYYFNKTMLIVLSISPVLS